MSSSINRTGREVNDFFTRLWHWMFPTADEVRWAIEQSLPPDEKIEWFIREAKIGTMGRVAVVATNRHLVIMSHFFFRRYYDFHPWTKLRDLRFIEGFKHSVLIFTRIDTQKRVVIRRIETERGRLLTGHARKMLAIHEAEKIALGKQCPYCKELIKYTANVCPNCHHELAPPPTAAPRPATPPSQPPKKD
jgi:hypothetical protein